MKTIKFGKSKISENGPIYFIAEIGQNHQGSVETALEIVKTAALCGAHAVKFQKRHNKTLYTKSFFNKPYENENSFGKTYGEHREKLELDKAAFKKIKKAAEKHGLEFFATAFDFKSADFLEELGVAAYKIASGDITNLPLLTYVARFGKPMFMSTGASTMEEVRLAYDAVAKYNDQIVLLHCTSAYPTDYPNLNLRIIETLKDEFPEAIIGYSGHDNGISASVIAHMLGAVVFEKHFTLNHAWKGTDHSMSLEPEGLRKQIRDLQRVSISLGDSKKIIRDFERDVRFKMGKSIYAAKKLAKGHVVTKKDLVLKSPMAGLPPYCLDQVIGKKIKTALAEEEPVLLVNLA